MAKKGSRASKPATKLVPGKDSRRWIYAGADLIFTIGYVWAFSELVQNRFGWARAILYILPFCTVVMAAGTLVRGKWGWLATVVGGTGMLLWTVAFIILLLVTASYLSGVYGAFGKAAASGAVLSTAFVVQFAATLPALQLKWAMTRSGRRAFGLTPLWKAAA
ncbi:MAG TPA: hypothetical protein VM261_20490 [Kofleriaceae bacterium]|nr:hypothetical protein [Kofleriaceae bacterium]